MKHTKLCKELTQVGCPCVCPVLLPAKIEPTAHGAQPVGYWKNHAVIGGKGVAL